MTISSRTPEGIPSHCPICGSELKLEFSDPAGDATCPKCGCLVWHEGKAPPEGNVVVRLHESILTLETLNELLQWAGRREKVALTLDLNEVAYVASAALGRLLNLKKVVQKQKGSVRLINIHPDLLEVFRITRLDQVLRLEK